MEKREIRRIRVIPSADDANGYSRQERVLVGLPQDWARALASLIRKSDEQRDAGLLVTNVGPGSRAAIAGIARGDVLLRYDGVQLNNAETLTRIADDETRGHVAVEVLRGADELTFKVAGGRLGVTVSALLYRSGPLQKIRPRKLRARRHLELPDLDTEAFVEVSGDHLGKVLFLKALLTGQGNSKQKKKVKALLSTVAKIEAL
jgi:hypothetical protein